MPSQVKDQIKLVLTFHQTLKQVSEILKKRTLTFNQISIVTQRACVAEPKLKNPRDKLVRSKLKIHRLADEESFESGGKSNCQIWKYIHSKVFIQIYPSYG